METLEKSNFNNNDLSIQSIVDINSLINKDTISLIRVKENNYADLFIYNNDIIIADSGLQPFDNSRVIVSMNGFLSVKILRIIDGRMFVQGSDYKFMSLSIGDIQFNIVGIIIGVIHNCNNKTA